MPFYYELDYDEELDLYTVLNRHNGHKYDIRRNKDGSFEHECKATLVNGEHYLCRHKKLIIKKFFIKDEKAKKMFNLTKERKKN